MGQGAFDEEELVAMDQRLVFEHTPEALDLVGGPMGEIGQGAFMDLFALAAAFAQEEGRGRVAVGDGLDLHGTMLSSRNTMSRVIIIIYMGTLIHTPPHPSLGKQMA